MFTKVLIANRGTVACRIQRTLRRLNIASVAVFLGGRSRAAGTPREADEAVCIGGALAADSYLRADRILEAAVATGAQAIHPGLWLPERERRNLRGTASCAALPS